MSATDTARLCDLLSLGLDIQRGAHTIGDYTAWVDLAVTELARHGRDARLPDPVFDRTLARLWREANVGAESLE